ncbi:hypothetical protein [Anderseniella sp. Alg231-50]|uniref:hypothetical protein n=1 Tax=Anderseniella sp. Alg231-50 TaxID=1922226 RepID=UPI00307B2F11
MTLKFNMRTGLALIALPFLAACSETSVLDAFDSGNRGEENGAIVSNQPLSVPPDLSLRQPGAANAPAYTGNGLQVQQGQRATNQTYQAPPPPQPQTQQPAWQNSATAPAQQQQAYQAPPKPRDTTAGISNSVIQSRNPADEPYLRHGINPYNADGTRKKQSVLDKEARAKKIELERSKNPNYGTVFNSGEFWSSN